MQHELWLGIVCYLLTGVLNVALSFKTPEQWEEYANSRPRGAMCIKLLRKIGLDLPGVIRIARAFFASRSLKGG